MIRISKVGNLTFHMHIGCESIKTATPRKALVALHLTALKDHYTIEFCDICQITGAS